MEEKYLYTLDGKQIMHKNGKPVMIRYHLCKTELQAPASTPEGRRRGVVGRMEK